MKAQEFKNRLKKYMSIEAMSRYEEPVANELRENISNQYEVSRDKFGSIIFFKKSKKQNAPKVMIAAHMDEVGYVVKSINKLGQILLSPIGGIW
ncbi:Glutamyl aminopeptidase, partial [Mycoplasmopsis edwardii]